jgi:Flp pilus assembly CpaE family ATPase
MKPLCVLLVEDDSDYAALVLRWLSADPSNAEFVLNWTDSLSAALARLEEGGIDLILLDLGLPDSDGLPTFEAIRKKAADLPIVILSGADDEALALQTIQEGAQDYMIKFSCSPDLLMRTLRHTAVRYRSNRRNTAAEASSTTVIGVVSGSGGAGATTVASVLAAELRHHADLATLLIDLDVSPGLVAFTTGIDPQYSVHDALECADRLDKSIWEGIVTRRAGNLDVLASTRAMAASHLAIENLRMLITFARTCYRFVVADLGRINHFSKQVLQGVDEVILVTGPGISALHQCKQAVQIFHDLGVPQDHVRLILNRKDPANRLTGKEIQTLFGIEIDATLPPSYEDLYTACLQKRLPAVTSDFRLALAAVARNLAGLPETPKRSFLSLTSITGKLLNIGEANGKSVAS